MKKEINAHIFALKAPEEYLPLDQYSGKKTLIPANKELFFRINSVLRLHPGEHFVLFDYNHNLECEIIEITKKDIRCLIHKKNANKRLQPEITCVIPILKREALETLIDSLTQLGATTIQLAITQKSHRSKLDQKEFDRLERIMIASAEQSKNYNFPVLKKAEPLLTLSFNKTTNSFFLDPEGNNCFEIMSSLRLEQPKSITLIIGPEGDLTLKEKEFIHANKVAFMALTPTILRAELAAALALGSFRSLFNA